MAIDANESLVPRRVANWCFDFAHGNIQSLLVLMDKPVKIPTYIPSMSIMHSLFSYLCNLSIKNSWVVSLWDNPI